VKAGIVRTAANVKDAPCRGSPPRSRRRDSAGALNIKSGGTRDGERFREESFDVRIENLTYLEAVKTLQRLSAGSLPVTIRSASLKSRYDDPRYLDVTLRVGFLTRNPSAAFHKYGCIRGPLHPPGCVVPLMPNKEYDIGRQGYPRESISSGSGAPPCAYLPVRLGRDALPDAAHRPLGATPYL